MSEIKIFSLLASLSNLERKKVQTSLKAKGRKGQNPEVLSQFFVLCVNEMLREDGGDANEIKLRIWKKLCPNEGYNDGRFRKHSFRLNQYIQEFLIGENLRAKDHLALRQELLYETLWNRKQTKAMESLGRKLEGDEVELGRVRQFIQMREMLEQDPCKYSVEEVGSDLGKLSELFEMDYVFNALRMSSMQMVHGVTVDPVQIREILNKGEALLGKSELFRVYWHLCATLMAVTQTSIVNGLIDRRATVQEFLTYFKEVEGISFKERFLVYKLLANFLVRSINTEEAGPADFLKCFLGLERSFAENSPQFWEPIKPQRFLSLFDRGLGKLDSSQALAILEENIQLVEPRFREKLKTTIRASYKFYDRAYQELLDLNDPEELVPEITAPEEKRLDIRLGLIQMQSRALQSPDSKVVRISRWVNKCIKKCPTLTSSAKSAFSEIVEYTLMLQKRWPVNVIEESLERLNSLEDNQDLRVHVTWLKEQFNYKLPNPAA